MISMATLLEYITLVMIVILVQYFGGTAPQLSTVIQLWPAVLYSNNIV